MNTACDSAKAAEVAKTDTGAAHGPGLGLEREARRIVEQELCRRRAALAALPQTDLEAITMLAQRVGLGVAGWLASEAVRDERLARALAARR